MSSSIIDALSETNQARVATILESCLFALEHGERLSPEELLEAHPDLAEPLGKCLTTLMTLHAAVHGEAAPTSGDLPEPGMRLGDYVLEEQIGRGGMGVVYRASQISLDRLVAVKLLPNSHLLTPLQLRRFLLESRAVAQLQHDHIVPVYAVGQEKNTHYFAMQLIAGCSLEKVDYRTWSNNGCRQLIGAAIDMADALAHAHASGIIHRDIKPSNILLDEHNKVWVTDFGLAICQSDTRLTMSGDLVGTMNYMSPEQSQGKPVDERTDIYSLGVTLYELVTGQVAFPGKNRADVFHAIEYDEPKAPRQLNAQCPYDLETIILKAISKSRDDRYLRAADMRDDLQRVLAGQPIEGRRPGIWQRVYRWTERHRSLAIVAGVGVLATCLSITIGAAQVLLTRSQLLATRIESENNLATAENNYWQGRNLVQRWNKDVVRKLADIPGAEALQARMLTDTIDYYEAFLRKAQAQVERKDSHWPTDPALAKDVAAARLGLAAALDARGQTDRAMVAYEQAIAELKRIHSYDPAVNSKLATAQNDWAVALLREGKPEQARQQLSEALQRLTRSEPEQQADMAAMHANLARAAMALGEPNSQATELELSEKMYRQAISKAPSESERQALQSELAAVLDLHALTLANRDKPAATAISQQAIKLHQSCCEVAGAPLDWQRRLAASQHNCAVLLLEQGQDDAARRLLQDAIETKLMIGRRTGLRPGTGSDAATSYLTLGRLERRQQKLTAAGECFVQAIAAIKHDLASLPTLENRLLLAESLISYWRLNKDEKTRLELRELIKEIRQSSLTDSQANLVHKLEQNITTQSTDGNEPVAPGQVSPVEPEVRRGDRLSETE